MALTDKLEKVNKLKLELDALQPMSHENELELWKKIRLDWNYNSNHIEGNTLTYGETMLLLIFDKTTGDHELREYEEMKAHDVAIHIVKEWAKDKSRDLTESDIRELNKILLVQPYWKEAITLDGQPTRRQIKVGEYKEHPNSVRLKTGEIFQYASPLETPHKMADLMQWYRNNNVEHPLVLASQLHYDFIRIHPFDDGNGRVARLMVNYVLMRNEYPPIIVKANEKEKYLTALNKADTGDINAFHEYMADQLLWSLEMGIKASKGECIEEPEDLDKKIYLLEKEIADVDVDNEAQLNFGKDVFLRIYDTWLSALIKGLVIQIKKFDKFFVKPTHFIIVRTAEHKGMGGHSVSVQIEGKDENAIINELKEEIFNKSHIVAADTKVSIHSAYGTFKKGALVNPFGCNYHVDIFFDYVKYEVFIPLNGKGIERFPIIDEHLKEILNNNPQLKIAYFDNSGNYHYDDKFGTFTKPSNGAEMFEIPREDILRGEIKSGGMKRYVEPRLLHKPLKENEIEEICQHFGNTIFEHIDFYTKKAGLR